MSSLIRPWYSAVDEKDGGKAIIRPVVSHFNVPIYVDHA